MEIFQNSFRLYYFNVFFKAYVYKLRFKHICVSSLKNKITMCFKRKTKFGNNSINSFTFYFLSVTKIFNRITKCLKRKEKLYLLALFKMSLFEKNVKRLSELCRISPNMLNWLTGANYFQTSANAAKFIAEKLVLSPLVNIFVV